MYETRAKNANVRVNLLQFICTNSIQLVKVDYYNVYLRHTIHFYYRFFLLLFRCCYSISIVNKWNGTFYIVAYCLHIKIRKRIRCIMRICEYRHNADRPGYSQTVLLIKQNGHFVLISAFFGSLLTWILQA